MILESVKELTPPKPTKLDWNAEKDCRVVFRANEFHMRQTPKLLIQIKNHVISFRLTGKRARAISAWLIRYAEWAENQQSQGGR